MSITRAEAADMSDVVLLIVADRLRDSLRDDWRKGLPGKLSELYGLAVIYGEAVLRGVPLPSPMLPGQLALDIEAFGYTESPPLQ